MYYIDYRNGAMGNTLLAHILYACGKCTHDNVFSEEGHAHAIEKFNNTNLTSNHQIEYPIQGKCLIEFRAHDWYEILRQKLSYEKWHKQYPDANNYKEFGIEFPPLKDNWQEFYQVFKDPSWPACATYNDIDQLEPYVQQEITDQYKKPTFDFVESLTMYYHELFKAQNYTALFGGMVYTLEDYCNKKFGALVEHVQKVLGWSWNESYSNQFYEKVKQVNQKYLNWLAQMQESYYNNNMNNLLDWECAMLRAYKLYKGDENGKTI